jgi:hypothetical protein
MKRKPIQPLPAVQVMPERKVRLDPSLVPSLAAWMVAVGQRWARDTRLTGRGLIGVEAVAFRRRAEFARHACSVVQTIIRSMMEQVPLEDYGRAAREWPGLACDDGGLGSQHDAEANGRMPAEMGG